MGRDHVSVLDFTDARNPARTHVLSFLQVGDPGEDMRELFAARRLWRDPPLSTEGFWQGKARVRSSRRRRALPARREPALPGPGRGGRPAGARAALPRGRSLRLAGCARARARGRGATTSTLTNARGEQAVFRVAELRPLAPRVVVGIDDERNLFRIVDLYHTLREYSWRGAGAELSVDGAAARRLPAVSQPRSPRRSARACSDATSSRRRASGSTRDGSRGRACATCPSDLQRGGDARSRLRRVPPAARRRRARRPSARERRRARRRLRARARGLSRRRPGAATCSSRSASRPRSARRRSRSRARSRSASTISWCANARRALARPAASEGCGRFRPFAGGDMAHEIDVDPQETREWLESLDSAIEREGAPRAHYLIERLIDQARRSGAHLPYTATTAYVNTIRKSDEEPLRGEPGLEHRLRSIVRWNALAMVMKANLVSKELGGHIATFASAATLYDVGFNHFFHAPTRDARRRSRVLPGPQLARDLRARLPRGAPHGGAAAALPPGGRRRRALLVSAPVADARLLAVPDGLDGAQPADGHLPGALHALPARPRARRHQRPQGLGVRGRRRDGRAGVARRRLAGRARAARQPDLRGELQPPAPRRPGARQRQDHPGARGRLPRRRLERDQGDLGRRLGPAARARQARPAAQAHGGGARRRLPELQGEGRRLHARALLREVPAAARAGREPDRRRHLAAQPRRARPAEGLRGLRGGGRSTRASPP